MTEPSIDDLAQALQTQIMQDDEAGCEVTAIQLGERGQQALPTIRQLLASTDVDTRFWAIRSLWANGAEEAQALLIDCLTDADEMVCSGAAMALGELKSEAAVPELMRLLQEEAGTTGNHATDALGKIGQPAAAVLIDALKSQHSLIRLRAAKALAPIESHAAIPALIKAMDHDPSYLVRHYADVALKRMGVGEMIYFR
jgi:HEAT repeat protein